MKDVEHVSGCRANSWRGVREAQSQRALDSSVRAMQSIRTRWLEAERCNNDLDVVEVREATESTGRESIRGSRIKESNSTSRVKNKDIGNGTRKEEKKEGTRGREAKV